VSKATRVTAQALSQVKFR